ncbi:hypothetical protein AX17_005800 [Amanita inopinata Kibby_2008]|nr:hypothetical protein AX17_005800 [Amanita inopinata Kibby_2008]
MTDGELIARVRASYPDNSDPPNDLSRWRCRKCSKARSTVAPKSHQNQTIEILDADFSPTLARSHPADRYLVTSALPARHPAPPTVIDLTNEVSPVDATDHDRDKILGPEPIVLSNHSTVEATRPTEARRQVLAHLVAQQPMKAKLSDALPRVSASPAHRPFFWLRQVIPEPVELNWIQRAIMRRQGRGIARSGSDHIGTKRSG